MNTSEITIEADLFEKASGIPELLEKQDLNVKFVRLSTGDYLINDIISVERKTIADFIQSLFSGRLFRQCGQLKRQSVRCILILEGNLHEHRSKVHYAAIEGAILTISLSWQIPIIYSEDKRHTARILLNAGKSLTKNTFRVISGKTGPYIHFKKRTPQEHFLSAIPAIGPAKAGMLLRKFGSVSSVVNAGTDALSLTKGIGETTAKKIRAFFEEKAKI